MDFKSPTLRATSVKSTLPAEGLKNYENHIAIKIKSNNSQAIVLVKGSKPH